MGAVLEAIRKGFGVATKSLGLVLVLFIFNLIGNLASLPFATIAPASGGAIPPGLAGGALLFSLLFILISIFIQGGTLGLIRDQIKEGRMKLASMARYGLKYYLRLLGLGAFILLVIGIIAIIAGIMIAATSPLNNAVVTSIAVIIAIVIAVAASLFFFIPFTLSPYAVVCDEMGVIESLKRGIKAGRTPFSKVFILLALIVLLVLIALGIGFVVGFVVGLLAAVLPAAVAKIIMMVVTSAINGYIGVVVSAAFITYYLAVSRKESVV